MVLLVKDITSFAKHLENSSGHTYSELLSKFGEMSFQEYVSEGISHPVFYGVLVYKLRRVNFFQASVTIVAGFSPEFDPPFIWRSKHHTKNDCVYH